MNKNKLITGAIVLIIIIASVAYYASTSKERSIQKDEINSINEATQVDTTESIDSSLNSIDIESGTDVDMNSIDKELNVL